MFLLCFNDLSNLSNVGDLSNLGDLSQHSDLLIFTGVLINNSALHVDKARLFEWQHSPSRTFGAGDKIDTNLYYCLILSPIRTQHLHCTFLTSFNYYLTQGWANYGEQDHFMRPATTCKNSYASRITCCFSFN